MLRKILLGTSLFLIFSALALVGVVYYYQDKIIQMIVGEFNKYLHAKVAVEKISLNVWDRFPEVSLHFYNTRITESIPNSDSTLAFVQDIYFGFNVWDAWNGSVAIKDFTMKKGHIRMKITSDGQLNYLIFKSDTTNQTSKVKIDLKEIQLEKISYVFSNQMSQQEYALFTDKSSALLVFTNDAFKAKWEGNYLIHYLQFGTDRYFKEKNIDLQGQVIVNLTKNQLHLSQATVQLGPSYFEVECVWKFGVESSLALDFQGKNTNIQTLVSLLSPQMVKRLSVYKSKGDVYFKGSLAGELNRGRSLDLKIDFGFKNASLFHPEYKKEIRKAYLDGVLIVTDDQQKLSIDQVQLELEGQPILAHMRLENFKDPFLDLWLQTRLKLNDVLAFYPVPSIENIRGRLGVELAFKGRINELKSNSLKKSIELSGFAQWDSVHIKPKEALVTFHSPRGEFKFKNNDWQINNALVQWGRSDISIQGHVVNLLPYLADSVQEVEVKGKCTSKSIDFNEPWFASQGRTSTHIQFPKRWNVQWEHQVEKLVFNKLYATQNDIKLKIKNNLMQADVLQANVFGGKVKMKIQGKDSSQHMYIQIKAETKNTYIDSVFMGLDDFGQSFITHQTIKGQFNLDFDGSFRLNKDLSWDPKSLQGKAKMEVKNGELISFEPLQKLSKFIDEKELENIKFSTLSNTFIFENQTIGIPKMEIKSNVNTLWIEGSHSYENYLDYKLKVSLKNRKRKDKDASFGAVEEDRKGMHLFLTMKGPADNIKIAYDIKSVGENIKDGLQREKQELRNALTDEKQPEKKTQELKEDEYLDVN